MRITIAVLVAAVVMFFVVEHIDCVGGSYPVKGPVPTGAGSAEGDAAEYVALPHDALVGHRAPAITLELLDGTHVELANNLGHRPIYLELWATWDPQSREQMPHLAETFVLRHDQLAVYAVDIGVADPIENVRAFVAANKLVMPVAIDRDGSIAEQLHLNVTPQHVLIDRSGVIRYVGQALAPELERALEAIVDPQPRSAALPLSSPAAMPPLVLDDGTQLDLATRAKTPLALTFAVLFCDAYFGTQIGTACAAHARQLEAVHKTHPELRWITVAYPVWTNDGDVRDFHKHFGTTVPIGIDRGNAWFHKFGVSDAFTTVLLDGSGAELGRTAGDGAGLPALIAKSPS